METGAEKKLARISLLDQQSSDVDENETPASLWPTRVRPGERSSKRTSTVSATSADRTPSDPGALRRSRIGSLRREAFGPEDGTTSLHISPRASTEIPTSTTGGDHSTVMNSTAPPSTYNGEGARRRATSLNSRFPGDQSHRPLDIIRRESLQAHRAPHLRKHAHHGADTIDQLAAGSLGDVTAWHHEGPYDAASLARNRKYKNSPLEAIESTNRESLKSVHRARVSDSITRHRPLDGFAVVPPGIPDRHGNVFYYEEGTDLQRHNGADYRRWPGINYHPNDLKGKGEPSYSIEHALKQHKMRDHRRVISEGGIELSSGIGRPRSLHVAGSGNEPSYAEWQADLRRSSSGTGSGTGVGKLASRLRHRRGRTVDVGASEGAAGERGAADDLVEERPGEE